LKKVPTTKEEFKPNPEFLKTIMEMGFTEKLAAEALK
jgi:uncharacterized UBP type Zn finger protein